MNGKIFKKLCGLIDLDLKHRGTLRSLKKNISPAHANRYCWNLIGAPLPLRVALIEGQI
jgi:hypothetical protein